MNQSLFANAYQGRRVFLTGHTGFKGSWMAQWLVMMGAEVTGFSLDDAGERSHFSDIGLGNRIEHVVGDIRDGNHLSAAIDKCQPDFLFHLAAQSLVRYSYEHPVDTMSTNIMGVANVLDVLRRRNRPVACVIVTSDKCYENREMLSGYREDDPMGGRDPYSASKGAAEIVAHSYLRSFFSARNSPVKMATGRAGNVIGGGDWSLDRIVPDCVRSLMAGERIQVRNPHATRPWQHVLESLSGYLWLGALLAGATSTPRVLHPSQAAESFNFGPWPQANRTVETMVEEVLQHWSGEWTHVADADAKYEASLLGLSIDRAFHKLNWFPTLDFAKAVAMTAEWYRDTHEGKVSPLERTQADIAAYTEQAASNGVAWVD